MKARGNNGLKLGDYGLEESKGREIPLTSFEN